MNYRRFLSFALLLAIGGSAMVSARAQTIADPNLYVGEYANEDVFRIGQDGNSKTTFISAFGTGHRFSAMAFDSVGNLLVATGGGSSGQGNEVRKFSSTGTFLGNFTTGLSLPSSLTIDSTDNVYVGEGNDIVKFSSTGARLSTFTASGLGNVGAVALGAGGILYVSDYTNGAVRRFTSTGTDLGNFVTGLGSTQGLTVDPFGNLYVTSRTTNSLRKFNAVGVLTATFTGLTDPLNVTSDSSGNIYVASYAGNTAGASYIEKYSAGGQDLGKITTGLTGAFGVAFRQSGTAAAPEPATFALIALGGVFLRRRRRG